MTVCRARNTDASFASWCSHWVGRLICRQWLRKWIAQIYCQEPLNYVTQSIWLSMQRFLRDVLALRHVS